MSTRVTRRRAAESASDEGRRRALLESAIAVFMRFGYRKTSMDEVARAAHISRQGLYLHFSNKEDLFRAAVKQVLDTATQASEAALREGSLGLREQLGRAFDVWVGRYAGMVGEGAADLAQAMSALVGPMYAEYESAFIDRVARAIAAAGLGAAYRPAGVSARQLAEISYATARGLKTSSSSPEAFSRSMGVAIRALCAPLGAPG